MTTEMSGINTLAYPKTTRSLARATDLRTDRLRGVILPSSLTAINHSMYKRIVTSNTTSQKSRFFRIVLRLCKKLDFIVSSVNFR